MRQLQMGLRQSLKHQRYQHLFLNQQKIEKPWGYLEAQSRCYQNVDLTEKVFVFGREASDHLINSKLMSCQSTYMVAFQGDVSPLNKDQMVQLS